MVDEQCVLCQANFLPQVMKDGKCPLCTKLYPDALSVEDIKITSKVKGRTMTEEVVQDMIYKTLNEAGISRVKCDGCNKKYFKKSAAQKYCSTECGAKSKEKDSMVKETNNAG